jgi:hypothetical protein
MVGAPVGAPVRQWPCRRPTQTPRFSNVGTAEVSLIISGVAGIASVGSLVITYRLGVQRFEHERSLADVADARSILAEAAVELHRATEALNLLRVHIEAAPMARDEDPPDADKLIASADEHGRELETQLASVRVRFKPTDPVAQSLSRAVDSMLGLVNAYRRRHGGRKDTASLEKREEKVTALRRDFDEAAAAFYEAAQTVAGSIL